MNQQNNQFNSFALGLIIGGILGILYAPAKGEETRKVLKKLLEEWAKKGEGLSGELGELINEVKEEEKITQIIGKITPIQSAGPQPQPPMVTRLPKRPPQFFQGV